MEDTGGSWMINKIWNIDILVFTDSFLKNITQGIIFEINLLLNLNFF